MLLADTNGTAYAPAYPKLQGSLTGLMLTATQVKEEAAQNAARAVASTKQLVGVLTHLKVQGKLVNPVTAIIVCLRQLLKEGYKRCIDNAREGDREKFIENYVNKGAHPLAFVDICQTREVPEMAG